MGTWSVKLYGSDEALDLRGTFDIVKRIPGGAEEIVQRVTGDHPNMRDPEDEGYTDCWFALADQLHAHGMEHPETSERARMIVSSGADIAMKRELEMSERDLVMRQAELEALLAKWATPAPKPKNRKIMKAPEPHPFEVGEIVAYPTSSGEPGNPYYPRLEDEYGWRADGWGSFIVLGRGHMMEYFAWEVLGRLNVHGPDQPSFEACAAGAIENQPYWTDLRGKQLAVQLGAAHSQKLISKMRMVRLGTLALDAARITAAVPTVDAKPRGYLSVPHSVLAWRGKGGRNLEFVGLPKPKAKLWLKDLV